MGAHNALAFAIRHPEMTERLVSVDVPPTIRLPRDRQALAGSDPARAGFDSIGAAFKEECPVYPLSSEETVMHRVRHNLNGTRMGDGGGNTAPMWRCTGVQTTSGMRYARFPVRP